MRIGFWGRYWVVRRLVMTNNLWLKATSSIMSRNIERERFRMGTSIFIRRPSQKAIRKISPVHFRTPYSKWAQEKICTKVINLTTFMSIIQAITQTAIQLHIRPDWQKQRKRRLSSQARRRIIILRRAKAPWRPWRNTNNLWISKPFPTYTH